MTTGHPVVAGLRRVRRIGRKTTRALDRVPRPRKLTAEHLGANYDTDWARKPLARFGRATLLTLFTKPMINVLASPRVHGLESLESLRAPVIFAANHASHLDTSLLLLSLPRRFRCRSIVAAAADYFFDKQWKAAFWALWLNIIPIEREKVGRKSTALAQRLLEDQWNLVIFPEGSRSRDGMITPFRGGAAYLAQKVGVQVVPVYIGGTHAILNPKTKLPKPGKTDVVFGAALTVDPDEKARDFNTRIEAAVRQLADETQKVNADAKPQWP